MIEEQKIANYTTSLEFSVHVYEMICKITHIPVLLTCVFQVVFGMSRQITAHEHFLEKAGGMLIKRCQSFQVGELPSTMILDGERFIWQLDHRCKDLF